MIFTPRFSVTHFPYCEGGMITAVVKRRSVRTSVEETLVEELNNQKWWKKHLPTVNRSILNDGRLPFP